MFTSKKDGDFLSSNLPQKTGGLMFAGGKGFISHILASSHSEEQYKTG